MSILKTRWVLKRQEVQFKSWAKLDPSFAAKMTSSCFKVVMRSPTRLTLAGLVQCTRLTWSTRHCRSRIRSDRLSGGQHTGNIVINRACCLLSNMQSMCWKSLDSLAYARALYLTIMVNWSSLTDSQHFFPLRTPFIYLHISSQLSALNSKDVEYSPGMTCAGFVETKKACTARMLIHIRMGIHDRHH